MRRPIADNKKDDIAITRDDVPYAMRPDFAFPILGLVAVLYVNMLIYDPTLRPGYFQAALATVCGIPMGLLFSVAHLMWVREQSERSHRDPKWKWMWMFFRVPSWGGAAAVAIGLVAMGIGLFGFDAIFGVLWRYYPKLLLVGLSAESVARVRSSGPYALWSATIVLYAGWIISISFYRVLRWYYTLPEDS